MKLKDFNTKSQIRRVLQTPGWTVLTATQEALGREDNDKANERLANALTVAGFDYLRLRGSYKGIDQGVSFLVGGMSARTALEWGRVFGQESVLVAAGLLYTDNTLNPVKPEETVIGAAAVKKDFYSLVEGQPNRCAFSLGLDLSKRINLETINKNFAKS